VLEALAELRVPGLDWVYEQLGVAGRRMRLGAALFGHKLSNLLGRPLRRAEDVETERLSRERDQVRRLLAELLAALRRDLQACPAELRGPLLARLPDLVGGPLEEVVFAWLGEVETARRAIISDAKARIVTDVLGMDAAINYRDCASLEDEIDRHFPNGIDLYFDNVGGATLDAVLPRMKAFGRIPVCGMIANYNNQTDPYKLRNIWQVLVNRITMRGFLAYEAADMLHEAETALADWVRNGKLVATENVATGLEAAPESFIRLMSGQTTGKTLVRLDDQVSTMADWKASRHG